MRPYLTVAHFRTSLGRFDRLRERARKLATCWAVVGGSSERVSVARFPDNRENTGDFLGFIGGRLLDAPITQGIAG